jgi:hypothetical protein
MIADVTPPGPDAVEAGSKVPPVETGDVAPVEVEPVVQEPVSSDQELLKPEVVQQAVAGVVVQLVERLNALTVDKFIEIESTRTGRIELEGAVALVEVKIMLRRQ